MFRNFFAHNELHARHQIRICLASAHIGSGSLGKAGNEWVLYDYAGFRLEGGCLIDTGSFCCIDVIFRCLWVL